MVPGYLGQTRGSLGVGIRLERTNPTEECFGIRLKKSSDPKRILRTVTSSTRRRIKTSYTYVVTHGTQMSTIRRIVPYVVACRYDR